MLEAELSSAEARSQEEVSSVVERHTGEVQKFRDENKQLALTICELEESLDKATTKVKEYKAEVVALERTLAG